MDNNKINKENLMVQLDKQTVENIVEYLWELVLTTNSGENAIQIGCLRDILKQKLDELERK